MKTKTKIKKIPISPMIDILLELEEIGMEFMDIEITRITENLDKIKIIAKDYYMAQESPEIKLDDKNINDIIAWQ